MTQRVSLCTHWVCEDCIARHLQEALHPQLLQQWQGQAAVQVLACERCQGIGAVLLLKGLPQSELLLQQAPHTCRQAAIGIDTQRVSM